MNTKVRRSIGLMFLAVVILLATVSWLYARCSPRDWYEIIINLIITTIGAFLGFVTALWLGKYSQNKKAKETKTNYTYSLMRGLTKLCQTLRTMTDGETTNKSLAQNFQSLNGKYVYLDFPEWEAMVSASDIHLFSNEPYFDNLCELSAKIKSFNNLENNVMVARLINGKINIDGVLMRKLTEIDTISSRILQSLSNSTEK